MDIIDELREQQEALIKELDGTVDIFLSTDKKNTNEIDEHLFGQFWNAGMRKVGKKKCIPLFKRVLKEQKRKRHFATDTGKRHFVTGLMSDIQLRLEFKQLGFDKMHPATYLNGERWNDEKVMPDEVKRKIEADAWANEISEKEVEGTRVDG